MTLVQLFTAIAEAIRNKKGTQAKIAAESFPTEIVDISTGKLTNEEYSEAQDDLDNILENTNVPKICLLDWSLLGYEEAPQSIKDDYDYAIEIKNDWDDSVTSLRSKFEDNKNLVYMPLVDTSNVTDMYRTFQGCSKLNTIPLLDVSNVNNMNTAFSGTSLISVPLLNTAKAENFGYMFNSCTELVNVPQLDTNLVTFMYGMFTGCSNLSNDSLNNILAMCTSAISYTRTKTLKELGLSQTQAETCKTLSNYQAFLDAGWTTGY